MLIHDNESLPPIPFPSHHLGEGPILLYVAVVTAHAEFLAKNKLKASILGLTRYQLPSFGHTTPHVVEEPVHKVMGNIPRSTAEATLCCLYLLIAIAIRMLSNKVT